MIVNMGEKKRKNARTKVDVHKNQNSYICGTCLLMKKINKYSLK